MRARTRAFTGLFVAVIGLSTAGLLMASERRNRSVPEKVTPTIPVAVAARDLPIGTVLRAEDVRMVRWPADVATPGAVNDAATLVGRGIITPIRRDEPLLLHRLSPTGSGAGLPVLIDPGSRAMTVRVDDVIGIAGFVQPGSFVDVLVTSAAGGQTRAAVILEGVKVLATGHTMQTELPADGTKGTSGAASSGTASEASSAVITLLVTPRQAEQLALASAQGRIQLALRNPLDQGANVTPPLARAPEPAPEPSRSRPAATAGAARRQPPAPGGVEVINGNKRAITTLRDTLR
jgi:pilus assembly protein CpaB